MFATGFVPIWSYDMPSVSLLWGTISTEFNGHRIRLKYGGPFWSCRAALGSWRKAVREGEGEAKAVKDLHARKTTGRLILVKRKGYSIDFRAIWEL